MAAVVRRSRHATGKVVRLNGIPRTIVGITPRNFVPPVAADADFYQPMPLDPTLPIYNVRTLDQVVGTTFAPRRLPVVLMTAFGALALLLASVGVYAMFATLAAAREREFGVRIALGATRGGIATLIMRQGGV